MKTKKQPRFWMTPLEWLVTIIIIAAILFVFLPSLERVRSTPYHLLCATNIAGLGIASLLYANDNNATYPAPEMWCDILMTNSDVIEKQFRCKADNIGPSSYAINPNCDVNSPGDVVLLFESKPGWNQHGGPELLNTENHHGDNCNILFNDISVDFVATKDLNDLNWGNER